ncbi:MAG TPA: universal stress protein [Bryobacteraceae bacterium]|nr:universal stress protein [Bryobacteraceae bacterium]
MRSLSEILLPTDFSPRSVDVARFAAGVARHFHSKTTLLHVLPSPNPAWCGLWDGDILQEVLARQQEDTCRRLKMFMDDEFPGLEVKRIVAEGSASEVITEYAASQHVDLIMMPTRGCTAFRRFLLGSVTAKVLHDVSCPVWTSSHITDGRSAAAVIPKVIVCAVELTPDGQTILEWASNLAAELQARLIVVHAIPSLEFHPETYFLEADMRRSLIGDARSRISKVVCNSPTPTAEVRVEGGNVTTLVRAAIEDSRADLLIIGRPIGGMLGRLRTHSYALIRESPCPVISI